MGPSDGISVLKICSGRYSHCVRVSALMHVPGAQREGSWHGLLSAHSLLNPRGEPLPSSSHQSPFYQLTGCSPSCLLIISVEKSMLHITRDLSGMWKTRQAHQWGSLISLHIIRWHSWRCRVGLRHLSYGWFAWCWCRGKKPLVYMLLCTVRSREPQHQRHFRGSWKCRVQLPPDLVNHNLYFNKTSCGSVALSRSVSYAPDGAAKLTSTVSNNDIWRSQELASGFRGSGCSCLMTLFSVICTNSSDCASHFCCVPGRTGYILVQGEWLGTGPLCVLGPLSPQGVFLHVPASLCPWGYHSVGCSFIAFKICFIFHYAISLSSLSFSWSTCSIPV